MANSLMDALENRYGSSNGGSSTTSSTTASTGTASSGGNSLMNALSNRYGTPTGTLTTQYNNTAGKVSGNTTTKKSGTTLTNTKENNEQSFLSRLIFGDKTSSYGRRWEKRGVGKKKTGWFGEDINSGTGTVDKETGEVHWKTKMDYADELEAKYANDVNSNTWFGRLESNFDTGSLQEEINLATKEYLDDPTEENLQYLQRVKQIYQNYATANAETVGQGGMISKDLANYLPQFGQQISNTAEILIENPVLAAVPGGVKGAMTVGSGVSAYNDMYGSAFNNLLEDTDDEELARTAAKDEAIVSSAIEMGETGISLAVGVGKGLFPGATAEVVEASKPMLNKFVTALGQYGLNIATEGNEEAMQNVISQANALRVKDGKGDGGIDELLEYCLKVLDKTYGSGRGTEEANAMRAETQESARAGRSVAAILGLVSTGAGHVMGNYNGEVNTNQQTVETNDAEINEIDAIISDMNSATRAATTILNNPTLLFAFEEQYGAVEGASKTEQTKNLAQKLHDISIGATATETETTQATETAEQPTPQINPLTGAEHPMAQPVPAMTAEQSYMRGLIINMEVDEILSTPENIALYEEITGETLPRKADGTIDKKKADSQIIKTGRGTRSGETTIAGNALNNNQQANPVQTEQTATQETETQQAPVQQAHPQTNPLNASAQAQAQQAQAQPVANPVNAQNTTQNATQRQNPLNTQATQENASNTAQNATNDIPTQPINTEPVEVPITPQNANTKPTGSTDTAHTQDSIAEDTFTPEQYAATGGQTEHTVIHDADVEAEAVRRINENREQATADILAKEDYDVYDVGVSNMLINEATEQLATNTDPTAVEGIVKKLAYLRKAREKAATKIGQALRQLGIFKKFSGSPADIISDASMQLYGEESTSSLSPAEKSNVFNMIQDFANKLGNLDTANTQETIDLIHEVSEARKTTGSMSSVDSKLVDKALHKIATMDGGQEFLRNLLTVQIRSIAGDYNSKGAINIGKAIRYLWALSNPKTSVTNVGANTVFGEALSVYDNNMSLPFDALLSMFTGKREVAFDKGLFSKETWQGASDALLKSMVEVALDAESDMANYAYDEIKGRTFKMSGNWMERFLSRLEMMQGFALKSTDQMAKGGVEAETKRGLNKLKPGNEVENAEIAKEEAKHRTLQSENFVSKTLTKFKDKVNSIPLLHIGNEKTGTYGLGDHFIMFAQVPANQVVTQLELQPVVGTAISAYKICQMIKEGQNGGVTSKTQRETARALGKTATGASIIGLSMLMSATGCLRCVDEDDDDLAVMLKSMGKTGTQWNIDAFMRMVTGGDSKPQDGDTWISMNWVPQLNSLMIMGNALYRSKVDDGSISFSEAILAMKDGLVDSLADFPAVSGITSTVKSVKYAKYEGEDRSTMDEDELAEKDIEAKAGALLGNEVGNFVSGFVVPNAVRGIATGTDDTERDTYGTNNPLERAVNQVKSGIPGWRQTIAPRLDNFGNEVKNEGGIIQFLNKTFLPGALSHDRSTVPQTLAESIYNETGDKDVIPDRKAPSSISITKNGEKETHYLTQEEKTAYQKRYGEICDTMYLKAANNAKFAKLPADQQAEILKDIKAYAKGIATSEYKKSIGEDYENDAYYLTNGKSRNGDDMPALEERNLVDYFTNKNMLDTAMDTGDYDTIDRIVRSYGEWNENLQEVFSARNSDINTYRKYAKSGIGSQTVDAYNDARSAIKTEEDTNSDGSRIKFKAIINADIPESEKEKLIAMEDNLSKNWKMVYDVLSDVGYSKQAVYDFFTNADWTLSQKSGEYEQNGQIGAYEAYAALQQENLTDEQRRYIFDAFAYATGEPGRYDNWSRLNKRTAEFIKYDYDYITRVAKNYGLDKYTGHNKAKAEATATASAPTNTAPQNLLTILAEKYG